MWHMRPVWILRQDGNRSFLAAEVPSGIRQADSSGKVHCFAEAFG